MGNNFLKDLKIREVIQDMHDRKVEGKMVFKGKEEKKEKEKEKEDQQQQQQQQQQGQVKQEQQKQEQQQPEQEIEQEDNDNEKNIVVNEQQPSEQQPAEQQRPLQFFQDDEETRAFHNYQLHVDPQTQEEYYEQRIEKIFETGANLQVGQQFEVALIARIDTIYNNCTYRACPQCAQKITSKCFKCNTEATDYFRFRLQCKLIDRFKKYIDVSIFEKSCTQLFVLNGIYPYNGHQFHYLDSKEQSEILKKINKSIQYKMIIKIQVFGHLVKDQDSGEKFQRICRNYSVKQIDFHQLQDLSFNEIRKKVKLNS